MLLPALLTDELRRLCSSSPVAAAALGCWALGNEAEVTGPRGRKVMRGAAEGILMCVWVVVLEKVVERWSKVGERLDVTGFL